MKLLEVEYANLKRENEFWSTQIARSKDPASLRERAGTTLKAVDPDKVIYASRRVNSAGKEVYAASFRQPGASRIANTAQR
jgi:cell division protein FtsB